MDGGSFTSLNGYAKQIIAGLDASGKPEVYAIASDNAVGVNNGPPGSAWADTSSRSARQSTTPLYAIGTDDAVYINYGVRHRLRPLGRLREADQRRCQLRRHPEVFAIGGNDSVVRQPIPAADQPGRLREADQRHDEQRGLRHRQIRRRLREQRRRVRPPGRLRQADQRQPRRHGQAGVFAFAIGL